MRDTGLAAGDKMEIASLLTSVNLPEALVSLCLLYTSMAAYTRSAMLEDGRLTGQTTDSGLFLDYAGLAAEDASFLGVPYTKKLTLSTLEAIRQDMERLASEGITGVDLRLRGYSGERCV